MQKLLFLSSKQWYIWEFSSVNVYSRNELRQYGEGDQEATPALLPRRATVPLQVVHDPVPDLWVVQEGPDRVVQVRYYEHKTFGWVHQKQNWLGDLLPDSIPCLTASEISLGVLSSITTRPPPCIYRSKGLLIAKKTRGCFKLDFSIPCRSGRKDLFHVYLEIKVFR